MKITRIEAMRYILAEQKLIYLRNNYKEKVQEVYDQIHPTKTVPNYHLGIMNVESINPMEFAIHLCELQEEYQEEREHLKRQCKVFQQVKKQLTDDDIKSIHNLCTIKKVQRILSDILPKKERINLLQDMREYDAEIEAMNETDLMNGYVDYVADCTSH